MILIGYSGHSYVIHGIFSSKGIAITGYCDNEEKKNNPFFLTYYGKELSENGLKAISDNGFFISIGDNTIRKKIYTELLSRNLLPTNAFHSKAIIDPSVTTEKHGIMIAAGSIINPLAKIGTGSICNTGCIIEHECQVGDFTHIAPGAVLCGNVFVGENSFIGAQSIVKEGVNIGKNVIVGAGAVVVKNVPDNTTVLGNPARLK